MEISYGISISGQVLPRKWNSRDGIPISGTENGNSIFGQRIDQFDLKIDPFWLEKSRILFGETKIIG